MTFKTEKTGKHLRSEAVEKGAEERERAMHALSHHYGTGSNATLAKLLMAALGDDSVESNTVAHNFTADSVHSRAMVVGQIAQPMGNGSNDADYQNKEVG